MIYVLKSAGYDESGNFTELIKLGFTNDWDRRYASYILHNPTIVPLFFYEGGTTEDEFNLRRYFQEYHYESYGNEWFVYSQEIIDFFARNSDIESIRASIPKAKRDRRPRKLLQVHIIKHVASIIEEFVEEIDYDSLVEELLGYEFIDTCPLLCLIRDHYPDSADRIIDNVVRWYITRAKLESNETRDLSDLELQVKDFMSKFDATPQDNKMKLFCTENIPSEAFPYILDLIPVYMKRFYIILGPDRCKALAYNYAKMEKECSINLLNRVPLKRAIYERFHVGDKVTKFEAKEALREIYGSLNYKKTPKAVDLEDWFRIKRAQIKNLELGKTSEGFELLKIRDT